jgi:hypothetical protein
MSSDRFGDGTYRLIVESEFDPDAPGLPPGNVEDALEHAASHNGLPGETWKLVDDMGKVIHEHEV